MVPKWSPKRVNPIKLQSKQVDIGGAKAFTMTGKPIFTHEPFTEVQERQEELDEVYFELWPGESEEETDHIDPEDFVACGRPDILVILPF